MNNKPLDSRDQSKILIFWMLLTPTVIFLVGVIPAIFLGFGLFMMKKNKDFSHIITAVRSFSIYTSLFLIGSLLFAFYYSTTLNGPEPDADSFVYSLVWFGASIAYLILVKFLFLNPLSKHREWVEINGIFSTKPKSNLDNSIVEFEIIKGEKLKQYSVADELTKWAKLKEDGHISDEEFNDARNKLLKRA